MKRLKQAKWPGGDLKQDFDMKAPLVIGSPFPARTFNKNSADTGSCGRLLRKTASNGLEPAMDAT